eukprot:2702553-Prymnesium_polylepis.1
MARLGLLLLATAAYAPRYHFFLKQHRRAELHEALTRVSDPALPSWGDHLNLASVQELQAPLPEHRTLVARHLHTLGATDIAWSGAHDK